MGIVEFYAKIFKPLRMKSLKSEQRSNLSDLHSYQPQVYLNRNRRSDCGALATD